MRAPTDMSIYISENLCPVSKNTTHGVAWEKWNRKTFENGPWPCIHCHQPVIPDRSRNTFRALHYLIEEDPW